MPLSTKEFNDLYEIIQGTHQEVQALYENTKDDNEFLSKKRDLLIAKLRTMTEKEKQDI